jgi:hypothetical protein
MARHFTVAQANALLPVLRPHVARLITAWHRLKNIQPEVLDTLARHPGEDLGGPLLAAAAAAVIRSQNAILAIHSLGAELKDPATGLLDFRALRNGGEVYLCWRYGEPAILFWHPLETGIAGRQPIDDAFE